MHADNLLLISGGEVSVLHSYEGIEGKSVSVSGGSVLAIMPSNGMTSKTTKCNSNNGFESVGAKTTKSLASAAKSPFQFPRKQ